LTTECACREVSPGAADEKPRYLARNFWLGVASGIAYHVYTVVLNPSLVMTWFVSQLTESNLLISLLMPIEYGSWYFLQLLLTGYVQRQRRLLPLYRAMGAVRLLALALMSALVFLLDLPALLLGVFFALYVTHAVAAGVAGLPYLDIIAKTVPPTRRGMYFGWRQFFGGALGLGAGAAVRGILNPASSFSFPDNFALVFALGLGVTAAMVGTFSLIKEPEGKVDARQLSLRERLRGAVRLAVEDRSYGRYLGLRFVIAAASVPSTLV